MQEIWSAKHKFLKNQSTVSFEKWLFFCKDFCKISNFQFVSVFDGTVRSVLKIRINKENFF